MGDGSRRSGRSGGGGSRCRRGGGPWRSGSAGRRGGVGCGGDRRSSRFGNGSRRQVAGRFAVRQRTEVGILNIAPVGPCGLRIRSVRVGRDDPVPVLSAGVRLAVNGADPSHREHKPVRGTGGGFPAQLDAAVNHHSVGFCAGRGHQKPAGNQGDPQAKGQEQRDQAAASHRHRESPQCVAFHDFILFQNCYDVNKKIKKIRQ